MAPRGLWLAWLVLVAFCSFLGGVIWAVREGKTKPQCYVFTQDEQLPERWYLAEQDCKRIVPGYVIR